MIISNKVFTEHRLLFLAGNRPIVCGVLVQEGYEPAACWRGYLAAVNATRPPGEPYNTFIAIEPLLLQ